MFKLSNKNRGFTLIESALAITILFVGLLTVVQFFPLGTKIIGDSRNITAASAIALSKIEELSLLSYENLPTGTIELKQPVSANPNSYLADYQRETMVETVDSDLNVSVNDTGLKKITVTVYWTSPIGKVEKSTQINALVADY